MVRSDTQRTLLDMGIQKLARELGAETAAAKIGVQLTGVYHNLLREWAEL